MSQSTTKLAAPESNGLLGQAVDVCRVIGQRSTMNILRGPALTAEAMIHHRDRKTSTMDQPQETTRHPGVKIYAESPDSTPTVEDTRVTSTNRRRTD